MASWEVNDTSATISGGMHGDVPATDQRRKRAYAMYTDQHGRAWGAVIENKTGDPCGPLEPQFSAPLQADQKYITVNSRQRKLEIRYPEIISDIENAQADWDKALRNYARQSYGDAAPAAIQNPPPALLDMVGPKPNGLGAREPWEAAMVGNKWILGLTDTKPEWAEEFYPEAQAPIEPRVLTITNSYPDADEEVTYPKWGGPQKGWGLSDGSYVEREDDEDKGPFKTRAESAEAALGG